MTDFDRTEMDYLLRRAQEEMVQAIRTNSPPAGAAHRRLSLLYSARALTALAGSEGENQPRRSVLS